MVALDRGRPRGGRSHRGWPLVYLEVRRLSSDLGRRMPTVAELDGLGVMEIGRLLAELRLEAGELRRTGQRGLFGGESNGGDR